jgi:hypothetical protein
MNTGSFTPKNKELLSKGWGSVPSKYATEIKQQYHNRILIIPDNHAIGLALNSMKQSDNKSEILKFRYEHSNMEVKKQLVVIIERVSEYYS